MNTQQKMSSDQMEQGTKNTAPDELSNVSENKKLSTLRTKKIKETPFTMVEYEGVVRLTINGIVACEKEWKSFRRCRRWTQKNMNIFQVACAITEAIDKLKKK